MYLLKTDPTKPGKYYYDGKWVDFEDKMVPIEVKWKGIIQYTEYRLARWCIYGPGEILYIFLLKLPLTSTIFQFSNAPTEHMPFAGLGIFPISSLLQEIINTQSLGGQFQESRTSRPVVTNELCQNDGRVEIIIFIVHDSHVQLHFRR